MNPTCLNRVFESSHFLLSSPLGHLGLICMMCLRCCRFAHAKSQLVSGNRSGPTVAAVAALLSRVARELCFLSPMCLPTEALVNPVQHVLTLTAPRHLQQLAPWDSVSAQQNQCILGRNDIYLFFADVLPLSPSLPILDYYESLNYCRKSLPHVYYFISISFRFTHSHSLDSFSPTLSTGSI